MGKKNKKRNRDDEDQQLDKVDAVTPLPQEEGGSTAPPQGIKVLKQQQQKQNKNNNSSSGGSGEASSHHLPASEQSSLLKASPAASGCKWTELRGVNLSPLVKSFLEEHLAFPTTTPVQARSIPLLLSNKDVVVEAMTGSGKTLAYLVPAVEMMLTQRARAVAKSNKQAILAVIVLPARELALQVHHVAKTFLQHVNGKMPTMLSAKEGGGANAVSFSTQCFIGGRDMSKDMDVFKQSGANLLIGTPGRLYELLVTSKHATSFDTSGLELLILDEADKLLEFGFKAKLDSLLKRLPKQRRTGLFSATQTKELADIARAGMRNPLAVSVRQSNAHEIAPAPGEAPKITETKPQVPEQLMNYYTITTLEQKHEVLVDLLEKHPNEKILLYVLTCAAVDWFALALPAMLKKRQEAQNEEQQEGDACPSSNSSSKKKSSSVRPVYGLHGQMQMKDRNQVYKALRGSASSNAITVCTDVAARGLDIPEVALVIQYDPPVAPSTFIHRIGRTARMGRSGLSVLFLLPHETEYIEFMRLQQVKLHKLDRKSGVMAVNSDDEDSDEEDLEQQQEGENPENKKRTLASVKPIRKGRGKGVTKDLKKAGKLKGKFRTKLRDSSAAVNEDEEPSESLCIYALREASMSNPKLNEHALRAFVSFLRAYKEHECRYIFQLRKVDIVHLVHFFGLFSVPNCGELRKMGRIKVPLQEEFQQHAVALRQQAKVRADQRANEKAQAAKEAEDQKISEEDKVEAAMLLRKKTIASEIHAKKEKIKAQATSQKKLSNAWKQADLDELLRESYLIKKEKLGRISKRRVDELSGNDAIENAMLSTRDRKLKSKVQQKRK